jgi:hypothetical protein
MHHPELALAANACLHLPIALDTSLFKRWAIRPTAIEQWLSKGRGCM